MRLLETEDPIAALRMMQEDRVLAVALPEARHIERLRQMIAIEPKPDPLRRLAALVEIDGEDALALAARLRFPNAWRHRLHGLAPPWPLDPRGDVRAQRRALYLLGAERSRDIALLLAAAEEMSRSRLAEFLDLARSWTPPVFPLAGRDVTALGIPPEPVGRLLAAVRDWWSKGDFAADRPACLTYLREIAKATS